MNNKQILEQAWALIQQPNAWTQGANARDATGKWLRLTQKRRRASAAQERYCSKQTNEDEALTACIHVNRVAFDLTGKGIVALNDNVSSVQELAEVWQKAIATA